MYPQNGVFTVDMHFRMEVHRWQYCSVDVNEIIIGMIRHDVAAAVPAPFTMAVVRFGIGIELVFTLCNLDGIGTPQRERIDRSG